MRVEPTLECIHAYQALVNFEQVRLGINVICQDINCPDKTHLPLIIPRPGRTDDQMPYHIYVNDTWHEVLTYVFDKPRDIIKEFGLKPFGGEETQNFIGLNSNGTLIWYIEPRDLSPEMIYKVVTPVLGAAMDKAVQVRVAATNAFMKEKLINSIADKLFRSADQNANRIQTAIDKKYSRIFHHKTEIKDHQKSLHLLKLQSKHFAGQKHQRFKIAERSALLLAESIPNKIEKILVAGPILQLYTNFITLDWQNEQYDMGKYRIDIPIAQGLDIPEVKIFCEDGTPEIGDGSQHPHVAQDGHCCLGNIEDTVATLQEKGAIAELGLLLVDFLHTYNNRSPYFYLSNNQKWDSCYEDTNPNECKDCNEDNCPHWENRHDRCWNYQEEYEEYETCITCGECDFSRTAADRCHSNQINNKTQNECMDCTITACKFNDNPATCWSSHYNEVICSICSYTECIHYVKDEEEEEDNDNEENNHPDTRNTEAGDNNTRNTNATRDIPF